jgi:hypothetical protein
LACLHLRNRGRCCLLVLCFVFCYFVLVFCCFFVFVFVLFFVCLLLFVFVFVCACVCYYYLLGRYLFRWTISLRGIIRPVVSVSALPWFIRYIYCWNLTFLNNVIIKKENECLPPSGIGDHSWCWLSCWGLLVYLLPTTFKLFSFPIFWLWAYLMKVIPETRRAH